MKISEILKIPWSISSIFITIRRSTSMQDYLLRPILVLFNLTPRRLDKQFNLLLKNTLRSSKISSLRLLEIGMMLLKSG
jgi:hypothetical protein